MNTIEICQLNRPQLRDFYSRHVNHHVLPFVDVVKTFLLNRESGNPLDRNHAQVEWTKRILPILDPTEKFLGLSHDALDYYFPETDRTQWGFNLPRPY